MKSTSFHTIIKNLVAPRYGFIKGVYEIENEGDDPSIFNLYTRCANPGFFGDSFSFSSMQNGGAALLWEDAMLAAIGESVERYALTQTQINDIFGSADDIDNTDLPPPILPEEIALFSSEQYKAQEFPYVRFDNSTKLFWSTVKDLGSGLNRSYPSCLLYIPYVAQDTEEIIGPAISTGAACGTSVDMIIANGLNECIERDTIMFYWLTGSRPYTLDPRRLPDFDLKFERVFDRSWLEYKVYLMLNDFNVPVVFCVLRDRSNLDVHTVVGGAASLDIYRATEKALVEAVQGRFWIKYMLRSGQLDDTVTNPTLITTFADHVRYYARADRWNEMSFLHECEEVPAVYLDKLLRQKPLSSSEAAKELVGRLQSKGYQVWYKDLTTADVALSGFQVGKVIAPQLINLNAEYTSRFLGSERLDSLLEILDVESQYTRESEFNPNPHPYP